MLFLSALAYSVKTGKAKKRRIFSYGSQITKYIISIQI